MQQHPEQGTATGWPYCVPVAACPPSVTTSSVATARGTARDQGQEQGTAAVRAAVSSSLLVGVMVGIMQVRRQQGVTWAAAVAAGRLPGEVARTSRAAAAWLAVGLAAICGSSSCSRVPTWRSMGPVEGGCGVAWLLMSVRNIMCVSVLTCSVPEQALPQRPVQVAECTWAAHMLAMPRASLNLCAVRVVLLQCMLLMLAGSKAAALWGLPAGSPLRGPALEFLWVRALGAPITVLLLVLQVREAPAANPAQDNCLVDCSADCAAPAKHCLAIVLTCCAAVLPVVLPSPTEYGWSVEVPAEHSGRCVHSLLVHAPIPSPPTRLPHVHCCIPQGCYRGFQDTRTPFYATLASNVINVVLGALFIFGMGWGVRGAAAGTVLAQVRGVRVEACSGSDGCQIHNQCHVLLQSSADAVLPCVVTLCCEHSTAAVSNSTSRDLQFKL